VQAIRGMKPPLSHRGTSIRLRVDRHSGQVTTILGDPTQKLTQMA